MACRLQIDADAYPDPDPAYHLNADADPDPTFQFYADPDPQHIWNDWLKWEHELEAR